MLRIGQKNILRVLKRLPQGVYLDGGRRNEILLPKRYVTEEHQIDSVVETFVYYDSEDRLVATTEDPYVYVEECANLKVLAVNQVGTFLDWGLSKDLLLPKKEQRNQLQVGDEVVVYVYLDDITNRIVATTYIDSHVSEQSFYFKEGEQVDLLVYDESDLAYKAIINHTHIGIIYKNEVFQPIKIGYQTKGYIKKIREDKKIDLSLRPVQADKKDEELEQLKKTIITHLISQQGVSQLSDKSSPDDIYDTFHVSKKLFKRALSQLYKERVIVIENNQVSLV